MPRRAGQPTIHGQVRERLLQGDSLQSVQSFVRTLTTNAWYSIRNLNIMRNELLDTSLARENRRIQEERRRARAIRRTEQSLNTDSVPYVYANGTANNAEDIETAVRRSRTMAQQTTEQRQTARAVSLPQELISDIDDNMTYGIEIEFLRKNNVSAGKIIQKIKDSGITIMQESYNHIARPHWKYTSDSSVSSHTDRYVGSNEIVSPILKGVEGLKQIAKVAKVLDKLKCSVNKTCGLHVHHGLNTFSDDEGMNIIKKSIIVYKRFQGYFNAMLPKSRRNAYYARSYTTSDISRIKRYGFNRGNSARYKVVNPCSYWRHKTVEFRQHSGTIDFTKIINWVKITQTIVKKAIEMPSNDIWNHTFARFTTEFSFTPYIKTYIKERTAKFRNVA